MTYETIRVEKKEQVATLYFDRPKSLNAFNDQMMNDVSEALGELDADPEVKAIIITGNEKAFAAGADIKEMAELDFAHAYGNNFITRNWEAVTRVRKPVIAAVSGYALGGGCELAMMCDMIVAASNARFSQPEVTIGVMPGAGGTQRLTRAIGKAKAMDMCLSARMMSAEEAERCGLVARIAPAGESVVDVAFEMAKAIAAFSLPVIMMIKESVNRAYETTLSEGVAGERRLFHSCFALEDQKEGMNAFIDKRKPQFKDK